MVKRFLLFVFMLAASQKLYSQNVSEFRERYSSLAAEAEVLSEDYSFMFRAISLADETPVGGSEGIVNRFARVCRSDNGRQRRVDGYSIQFTDKEVRQVSHSLLNGDKHLKTVGLAEASAIKEIDKSLGFRPDLPDSNPFWSVLGLELSFREGDQGGIARDYVDMHVVKDGHGKDGRYQALLINKLGTTSIQIVFAVEPKWAPVEVIFYKNPGKAVRPAAATVEELRDWHELGRNTAEWKKIDDDQWVPRKIFMRFCSTRTNVRYETEVEFTNWKFGKEVDSAVFAISNFTLENLRKLDFEKMEKDAFRDSQKLGRGN